MRAFSLAGLLVAVCIGLLIFAKFEAPTIKAGEKAKSQAQQISGRGENGEDASRTISFEADNRNNQFRGWVVKSFDDGNAMEKYYGFAVGDEIIKIGDQDASIFSGDDKGAYIQQEGFEKKAPLTVLRDGQTIVLPKGGSASGGNGLPAQLRNLGVPNQ